MQNDPQEKLYFYLLKGNIPSCLFCLQNHIFYQYIPLIHLSSTIIQPDHMPRAPIATSSLRRTLPHPGKV